MVKLIRFCTILVLFAFSTSSAFGPDQSAGNFEISLPYYDNLPAFEASLSPVGSTPLWRDFVSRNGNWAANVNTRTGLIHRAYGGSIYVGVPSNRGSAEDLAITFLGSNQDLLGIRIENLELVSVKQAMRHWIVAFKQVHNGLEIYESLILVNISDRGKVVEFQCDYHPLVDVKPTPVLSMVDASNIALQNIPSANAIEATDPELIIFPYPTESGFDYRLAYKTTVTSDEPLKLMTIIDASDGALLYRKNLIHYYSLDGYIYGQIYESTPFDTLITVPFPYEGVDIDGLLEVNSDLAGYFNAESPDQGPRALTTNLDGLYVDVYNMGGSNASITDSIVTGDTLEILWNLARSRHDERTGYYQANVIHEFIKSIDPDFTDLDFALPCNVNLNEFCNAYWDGASINFFRTGSGCSNTGEIADVIYHEYGHGITDYQYRPNSPSGAQHEGWSDYIAATITNQPLIGRGFYSNDENSYLRTVDNQNRYPEDWIGESHNDGLIVAGALWDLRELLAPRVRYCDSLYHFARYGYSANYEDYLLDILTFDDDDDNLFNGTPNSIAIYDAFGQHGIGPGDRVSIVHEQLPDTADAINPYRVVAQITSTITPLYEDSLFVFYRANFSGEFHPILLIETANPFEFAADIPAHPLGTILEYYIDVIDMNHAHHFSPASAPLVTYFFAVGHLQVRLYDNLESQTSWRIGAPGDNATTGLWTRVDPIGTYSDYDSSIVYQPEDDHTPDPGSYCYITGQHTIGEPNGFNDVDNGRTTLFSPKFDLSAYDNPVIEYFRWYTIRTSLDDSFFVDISNDSGQTWVNLEIIGDMENYWKKSRFLVSQFIQPTSRMVLRFIAEDTPPGSLVEAGIDDFSIYSFDMTAIDDPHDNLRPDRFSISQNYPNPFNASTNISFSLPVQSDVNLEIYNIAGGLIFSNHFKSLPAGEHSLVWDGQDNFNKTVSSGIYFYKVATPMNSETRKMVLLK